MAYRDERARRQADAARVLAQHTMTPSISRSFYFRSADPKMGNCYAFALTWRPGSLVLSGDCGELTLTHWHALSDFEGGLSWATHGDFDYLLSKSDKRQEFDREGTIAFIVEDLNRPVVEALNGWGGKYGPRRDGLRQELHRWRREVALNDRLFADACLFFDGLGLNVEEPEWDEFDVRQDDPRQEHLFERRHGSPDTTRAYGRRDVERWDVPDYWRGWVAAADELLGAFDFTDVRIAKHRREVKREIVRQCETEHEAVDLCYKLGFDDYYGSRTWSSHNLFQIAVIQHGVRMILDAEGAGQQAAA